MGEPLVTIGIPVYNGERFIAEAIESALQQDYGHLEIVISDNASTDGTSAVCERFAAKDSRIRYVRGDHNLGAARNYTKLVEFARGDFFKWAPCDDTNSANTISACIEALTAVGPDAVLAFPKTIIMDECGRDVCDYDDRLDLPARTGWRRLWRLARNLQLCNPAVGVIRTAVLRSTGMIRPCPGADVILLAELATRGRFIKVDSAEFRRRVHAGMSRAMHPTRETAATWFGSQAEAGAASSGSTSLNQQVVAGIAESAGSRTQRFTCTAGYLAGAWSRNVQCRVGRLRRRLTGRSDILPNFAIMSPGEIAQAQLESLRRASG